MGVFLGLVDFVRPLRAVYFGMDTQRRAAERCLGFANVRHVVCIYAIGSSKDARHKAHNALLSSGDDRNSGTV